MNVSELFELPANNPRIKREVSLTEEVDVQLVKDLVVVAINPVHKQKLGSMIPLLDQDGQQVVIYQQNEFAEKRRGAKHYVGRIRPQNSAGACRGTLTYQSRVVRNELCRGVMTDLDQVQAAQSILRAVFEIAGQSCPRLVSLINDSDNLRPAHITRKAWKGSVHACTFGGFPKGFQSDFLSQYKEEVHQNGVFLKEHAQELSPLLAVLVAYAEKKYATRQAGALAAGDVHWENPIGSFLSHLYMHFEAAASFELLNFLRSRGVDVQTIEYDGLKVTGVMNESLLAQANKHVQQATGMMHTRFVVKSMEIESGTEEEDVHARLEAYRNPSPTSAIVPSDGDPDGSIPVGPVGSDREAATMVWELLKERLACCNATLYLRSDGTGPWLTCRGDATLLNEIQRRPCITIIEKDDQKSKTRRSHNVSCCRSIITALEAYVKTEHNRPLFVDDCYRSCQGKFVFSNGVYDCATRIFSPWGTDLAQSVNALVTIHRAYPAETVNEDTIQDVFKTYVVSVFLTTNLKEATAAELEHATSKAKYLLALLARALAGHHEDKVWCLLQGQRNSGKGVLIELLRGAFGPYVAAVQAGNLFAKSHTGDSAKLNSWMLAVETARLCFINEVPDDRPLCGQTIKGLASGGDGHMSRQNYQDEQLTKFRSMLLIACNERPEVKPSDAYENAAVFGCEGEFIRAGDAQALREPQRKRAKLAVDDIKTRLQSAQVLDAFTMLLAGAYRSGKAEVAAELRDDVNSDVVKIGRQDQRAAIEKYFALQTDHGKNCMLWNGHLGAGNKSRMVQELWVALENVGIKSEQTLRQVLLREYSPGVENHKSGSRRGLKGVRLKSPDELRAEEPVATWHNRPITVLGGGCE